MYYQIARVLLAWFIPVMYEHAGSVPRLYRPVMINNPPRHILHSMYASTANIYTTFLYFFHAIDILNTIIFTFNSISIYKFPKISHKMGFEKTKDHSRKKHSKSRGLVIVLNEDIPTYSLIYKLL